MICCKNPKPKFPNKAFTMLEIIIAASILVTVIIAAYLVVSKPGQYSKSKMDEVVTYGQSKRIAMILHDEVKRSRKIWFPNSETPSSNYFVTEHTDGSRYQFYFDDSGNFVTRGRQGSGGLPRVLVRATSRRVRLKSAHFLSKSQKLEIYLKYELIENRKQIMEFFDSVSIPK
tara:strand:- start:355 stop:873 length:519 start_codon:yes stop_codon:yes gene_type:complete